MDLPVGEYLLHEITGESSCLYPRKDILFEIEAPENKKEAPSFSSNSDALSLVALDKKNDRISLSYSSDLLEEPTIEESSSRFGIGFVVATAVLSIVAVLFLGRRGRGKKRLSFTPAESISQDMDVLEDTSEGNEGEGQSTSGVSETGAEARPFSGEGVLACGAIPDVFLENIFGSEG